MVSIFSFLFFLDWTNQKATVNREPVNRGRPHRPPALPSHSEVPPSHPRSTPARRLQRLASAARSNSEGLEGLNDALLKRSGCRGEYHDHAASVAPLRFRQPTNLGPLALVAARGPCNGRLDGPEGGCLSKTTLLWGKQHHRSTKETHAASVAPLRSRQREPLRLSLMGTPLEVL